MQAIIKLGSLPEFGPSRTRALFQRLRDSGYGLEHLLEFTAEDLLRVGLSAHQAGRFLHADGQAVADRMIAAGVRLMTMLDEDVGTRLKRSGVSPWYFYVGTTDILDASSLGFSGSRDATPEAIRATEQIAMSACDRGWTVISGGARGVDMAAHLSAIRNGGSTVILLPQGIGTWRMPDELREGRVLVLSEFQPFDEWGSYRAMQRNKSIVHLSDWLMVPQAGIKGGSRNAAEYAIKQKQPTFVVDMGDGYEGNNALIDLGARPFVWGNQPDDLDQLLARPTSEKPSQTSLF